MKYKYIFFDFDGTLADTISGITIACNNVLRKYGFGIVYSKSEVMKFVGNGSEKLFLRAFKQTELNNQNISLYNDFMNEYKSIQINNLILYPNVLKTLQKLNEFDIKLYIYSNKPSEILTECVNNYFKTINFEMVIGNNLDIKPKPNTDYLNLLFKTSNIKKEDVLYVGDSIVDAIFAKKMQIDSVILTYGYGNYEEIHDVNPTYMFNNFSDILNL